MRNVSIIVLRGAIKSDRVIFTLFIIPYQYAPSQYTYINCY